MRILMAGMTSLQSGIRETTDEYVSPFTMLTKILTELGHEVEHREVWPGEELRGRYDIALVGIHAFNSIVTIRYKHGALWTASQLPHAVVVDDFQWSDIHHSVTNANAYWKCAHLDKSQMERFKAASKVSMEIEAVRKRWGQSFELCLFTMFRWGDRARITQKHPIKRILDWDPSPFVPRWTEPLPRERVQRRWVCACLRNRDEWIESLGLTWPVVKRYKPWIGEKKVKNAPQWRVPEAQLVRDEYATSWGNLAYLHPDSAGTGWWRVRFNYVLDQCRTVMVAHQAEVSALGEPFDVRPGQLELMSSQQLHNLAAQQWATWRSFTPSHDEEVARIASFLDVIAKEGRPITP
ncbi:hypothetical protein [Caudoviricetes sp.]|nr:hypothetical protein [Caudoviricetes sp.]UOF82773.1 hypothetical protein [Caudoviricetes sp.]